MRQPGRNYFGVDFDACRAGLLSCRAAAPFIEEVKHKADCAMKRSYEVLKISEYMEYCENGNRSHFERKYFERRNNAACLMMALWLTRDGKYVEPLTDHIFAVCDEFTWCVPAHSFIWEKPPVERVVRYVDLFTAETARLLTEIAVSVGEYLPWYATARIRCEIRRRVLDAYRECGHFHWEDYRNNWPAVCAGGTAAALLHFGTEEEIEAILPRLYRAAEMFLSGYGEDGCCQEGYAYWDYGFGHFVLFAEMIREYTGGAVNYFSEEKVRKIAAYAQKVVMGPGINASFSDTRPEFSFSIGLMSFLEKLYPRQISLPDLRFGRVGGNVYSIRDFLWFAPDYRSDELREETCYFGDAQWFLKRGKRFSFAAKGGHNGESHNHNDIGSFLIVVGEDMPLADLGAAEYTRDNFEESVRYTILNNSSRGHSVPMIDGQCQCAGQEYRAREVRAGEDSFSLDLSGAYKQGLVKRLRRSFQITEDAVCLRDSYEYSVRTVNIRERFVTYVQPLACERGIDLGSAALCFDRTRYREEISEECQEGSVYNRTVYLIDILPVRKRETEFVFYIIVN